MGRIQTDQLVPTKTSTSIFKMKIFQTIALLSVASGLRTVREAQYPQVNNQTGQVSDQTAQVSNQQPQVNNQAPQVSDQVPQMSNQTGQVSDQAPQVSDQVPQAAANATNGSY